MKADLTRFTKSLRTNQTLWEAKLWRHLRGGRFHGLKFKRQVPMGMYVVDFCCQEKKLAVELDGGQHSQPDVSRADLQRQAYLESQGYKVLRFWNNEVDVNLEEALLAIEEYIKNDLSPSLSPSPGERG